MSAAVLVAGTHAWRDMATKDWYCPGSAFAHELTRHGLSPVFAPNVFDANAAPWPFVWSTAIGGVGFGDDDLAVWQAAGFNLFQWCVPPWCPDERIAPEELVIVAHSHGLQVALWAFALGLKGRLISVGSPIRKDMLPVAESAKKNILRWVHVHSDWTDRFQWFGALFDGRCGIYRKHPLADVNLRIAAVGHSEILRDQAQFHHWGAIVSALCPAPTLVAKVMSAPGPDGHP